MHGVSCVERLGCHNFKLFKDSRKPRYLNSRSSLFVITALSAIIEIVFCFQEIYFKLAFLHIIISIRAAIPINTIIIVAVRNEFIDQVIICICVSLLKLAATLDVCSPSDPSLDFLIYKLFVREEITLFFACRR